MNAEEPLDKELAKLLGVLPDVKGAILSTRDGSCIASKLKPDVDESLMTKLIGFLFEQNEKLGQVCGKNIAFQDFSNCEYSVIRFETEYALTQVIDNDALLTVFTIKDIKLGLILLDTRRACERISRILRENKS